MRNAMRARADPSEPPHKPIVRCGDAHTILAKGKALKMHHHAAKACNPRACQTGRAAPAAHAEPAARALRVEARHARLSAPWRYTVDPEGRSNYQEYVLATELHPFSRFVLASDG